jgi:hypothetical protein
MYQESNIMKKMKIGSILSCTIIINMFVISSLYSQIRGAVQDIDGNVYQTITIGSQVWMAENLKTTRYNDGTVIPNITGNKAWRTNSTGACCYYKNKLSSKARFGTLYNWHAVSRANSKNVCPSGWHVPTDAEFTKLTSSLGSTNSGGLPGLPGDARGYTGKTRLFGGFGHWWSSTGSGTDYGVGWELFEVNSNGIMNQNKKQSGQCIRCLEDVEKELTSAQ